MSVKHINSLPEFNDVQRAAGAKLVVVDFHATWCGPCQAIAPRYEQLARQYAGRAIFLKVDVDAAEDVARHFNISAMPTFHFHLRSRLVGEISGADPDALAETIARHAPASADVSFSGEGQRLSASPTPSAAPNAQSARQIAASAAARRMEAAHAARAAAMGAAAPAAPVQPQASPSNSARKPAPAPSTPPAPDDDKPTQNDSRLKVNEILLGQMVNEMGFPRVRAEKALILTGNSGLEAAVEWCFEHADDPDVDEPLQIVTKEGASKPKLSSEEAKARADELMRRAREKREKEDKQEAADRERQRLRSGKEVTVARAKLEEQERKRAIELKRKEKREALAERQRVREMLEADKQRRHERFNMGRGAQPSAPVQPVPQPVSQPPSATAAAGKIQFRMPDGSKLEGEFEAAHTIGDLISFVVTKRPELGSQAIKLSQQYPRKLYSQADYGRSLADLKLLPRGALTVSL